VTSSKRRRRSAGDDSGSVLVVALIIVTVIAMVIGAVLSYADTNMRATIALRTASNAAATAEAGAKAALNTLDGNEFINQASSSTPDCFGAAGSTTLTLPNLMPNATGEAANSAIMDCAVDESTGADGVTVPITSSNKPGNAILTLSTNAAENGLEVKALNASLPFNVHGGIVSNSNINVTDGTLKSTVDVRAKTGCTGNIISTPPPACTVASVPGDPGYAAETTTVPAPATMPTTCPGGVATFQPGTYTDAQALSNFMDSSSSCKNSVWWFKPGVYYFDFQNTAGGHQWQVKTGQLIAGTPVNSAGTPIAAPSKPISVPGSCDNPIHSETAVGVQWIFGGDSQFQVVGSADAEICGTYHPDRPMLAVYGVKTSGTTTAAGNTGMTAGTLNATNFTPTVTSPATTPAAAVATAGDGKTITWTGATTSATLGATAFSPTFSIPAGSTLTSAKLKITYVTGATGTTAVKNRDLVVTPTPGTAIAKAMSVAAPTAAAPTLEADLTTDLADTVRNNGLTGLNVGYTVQKTPSSTAREIIDSITLDLTWTGAVMRAQSGCITQVFPGTGGCAVISTTTSFAGQFYIQGTTYTPLAPIDLNLSNVTAQVLRFGVVSRVLRVKETGAVNYQGPVIEIPDNSPGYGPGGTVVLLKVYVCEQSSTCSTSTGKLRLQVRAYIKDEGAPGPSGGRDVVVQSWATRR
jgi:hypothetical protein